jgi:hypothetical protein
MIVLGFLALAVAAVVCGILYFAGAFGAQAAATPAPGTPVPVLDVRRSLRVGVACAGVSSGFCAEGMQCYLGACVVPTSAPTTVAPAAPAAPAAPTENAVPVATVAATTLAPSPAPLAPQATSEPVAATPAPLAPVNPVPAPAASPAPVATVAATTLAPAPAPVQASGVVIDVNASDAQGSVVPNRKGGDGATLAGTFEAVTILGKRAIHVVNTSSSVPANKSALLLPTADIRTLSIWFYVTYVTGDGTGGNGCFLLDAREKTGGSYIVTKPLMVPNGKSDPWNQVTCYVNGGAAQQLSTAVAAFTTVSSAWQHVTLVASVLMPAADMRLFSRFTIDEGLDMNVGRVVAYDRVVSEAENAAAFRAGF